MPGNLSRYRWLGLLALLVVLAYVVPYAALSSIERITATFAFWTGFGLLAVGLIILVVSRWKV
jgi:hypothetical protein